MSEFGNPLQEIDPDKLFPDLASVTSIFPGTSPERPTITQYTKGLDLRGHLTPAVKTAIEKAEAIYSTSKAIIYMAGPLTGVEESLKTRYIRVNELLSTYTPVDSHTHAFFGYVPHLHGTDPVQHPDVSPDEVRDIDYLWARVVSDLHVNCLFPTAHGNAIELGWGEQSLIPTVNINPRGNKLSRLTKGMNNRMRDVEYEDFEADSMRELQLLFDEIHTWIATFPERDLREFFYLSFEVLRTPMLKLAGLDPNGFRPNIPVNKVMVYMKNPNDPHYRQAGDLLYNDWNESGDIGVRFPDGEIVSVNDQQADISYWRK